MGLLAGAGKRQFSQVSLLIFCDADFSPLNFFRSAVGEGISQEVLTGILARLPPRLQNALLRVKSQGAHSSA